jgi:ankyrin repeat protein
MMIMDLFYKKLNLYNKIMSNASMDIDRIIHALPCKERKIYDAINNGPYVYSRCEFPTYFDVYDLLKWSAEKSSLLAKHIIEKVNIDGHHNVDIQRLLSIACAYGHLDLVEYLADNYIEKFNSGDMNDACANNHLNVVEYLVKRFNLTLDDIYFRKWCGYLELKPYDARGASVIRWVLEKFDPPVDFIDYEDILRLACCGGIFDDVRYIIGKYGGTALQSHLVRRPNCFDIMYQNTDIMKYLVDNIFTTFNEHAKAFLLKAIEFENTQLMEHIVDKFNLGIHDMGTAPPYKPMIYKFLVEKFNLDAEFDYKNFSHQYLNLELVVFLTQKSKPSYHDARGLLSTSCSFGHLDIVKYLLDTFNIAFDENVLYVALRNSHLDVAAYLVERWNVCKYEHVSSPKHGCLYYCLDVVKYLVETFPNYDIRHDNNLALRDACKHDHVYIVKYIVERCNITVEEILSVDGVKFSALQEAVMGNCPQVVGYLVDKFNLSIK